MILAVCVDDNMGMLFNGRRQSQDREVRRQLLEDAGARTLWMSAYSAKQFPEEQEKERFRIDESFWDKAQAEDWCFVEAAVPAGKEAAIMQLVLFKWNRVYPADTYFDISLKGWKLAERGEFKGYSHETITKEVYIR
ncbi:MAG: ribonuclease Z [Firmicutes bacterium]|nr:ribonuclease Z [Bacillota bacterium]